MIRLKNIKVKEDVADLLRTYCILHNKKMAEFTTEILENKLREFRERLEVWKKIQ